MKIFFFFFFFFFFCVIKPIIFFIAKLFLLLARLMLNFLTWECLDRIVIMCFYENLVSIVSCMNH